MSGSRLDLPSGGAARVVDPDDRRASAPVIVLPAVAGVNAYIEGVQAQLASLGLRSAAIDYWWRAGGEPDLSSPEKVMAAVGAIDDRQVAADVAETQSALAGDGGALLGFCVGGSLALLSAAAAEDLRCVVAYYGLLHYPELTENKPRAPIDAVESVTAPILGHWGDSDHLVPLADVEELRARTRTRNAEILVYPGAGHAFGEPARPSYRPVAAAEAWQRTERYLSWYLSPDR